MTVEQRAFRRLFCPCARALGHTPSVSRIVRSCARCSPQCRTRPSMNACAVRTSWMSRCGRWGHRRPFRKVGVSGVCDGILRSPNDCERGRPPPRQCRRPCAPASCLLASGRMGDFGHAAVQHAGDDAANAALRRVHQVIQHLPGAPVVAVPSSPGSSPCPPEGDRSSSRMRRTVARFSSRGGHLGNSCGIDWPV